MRFAFPALTLLLFLIGCASEPPVRIKVSADANAQNVIFPQGTNVDHIEIEVSPTGAMIPTSINGKPALPFLFDSGSTVNAISVELAEDLGLVKLDTKVTALIGQVESEDRLYYAETLQIGNIIFEHVSFRAMEPGKGIKSKPEQLLGIHLFEKHPFTLNLAEGRLSVYNVPPPQISNWNEMDLPEMRIPQIQVVARDPTTGNHLFEFKAFIDTGAKGSDYPSVIMPRTLPASDPRIKPFLKGDGKTTELVTSLSASPFTYYVAELQLDYGPVEASGEFVLLFEDPEKGTFAFEEWGILKLSMFLKSSLTFDLANKRWAIVYAVDEIKPEDTSISTPPKEQSDLPE